MKKEELKQINVKDLFFGIFFASFSQALVSYFLPFFLKERGFSALEIGGLFTIGIAIGSLLFGLIFSRILRKIKLKSGLVSSAILNSARTFILYLFPNAGGTVANQFSGETYNQISRISIDTTIQHNVIVGEEKKTGARWWLFDGFGLIAGIILAMILISPVGFNISFLIFSGIALLSLFFYTRINDKTRLISNIKFSRLPKISRKLKLILFSEVIYWLALSSSFSLVITFLVTDKLSGGILQIGLLFIALYVSMNLTLFLAKGKLEKFDDTKTAILGMGLLLMSAIIVILSKNFYVYSLAFILEGIGAGIWGPSKTALQWKNTEKENREKVSGWLSGLRGFVNAVGPLIGGFLITVIGINAPFYLKAGIALISLSVYVYILKKK